MVEDTKGQDSHDLRLAHSHNFDFLLCLEVVVKCFPHRYPKITHNFNLFMPRPQKKPLSDAQDYELHPPKSHAIHHTEGFANEDCHGRSHSLGDRDISFAVSSSREPPPQPLGKPTAKKTFHILHILAGGLSLICLALAIAAVANESLSWRLGVNNHQLIVIGFLLQIMSLCLASTTPTLFLLLEARFGSSTLQNYDGILRNQVLGSKLGLLWRLVLSVMLALPLGLSVAYKTFAGGESARKVDPAAYVGNASYYGMFAPPGLQLLGAKTGVLLFSNATLPFAVASSSQTGFEPSLPMHAQAYGFNLLPLNNESTAILDIPEPSYVSTVQKLLAGGESWNIIAPVFATVATFNHSGTEDRDEFESDFISFCTSAQESSGAFTHMSMMDHFSVNLIDHASPGDQSRQYIALSPDPGISYNPSCENLTHDAQPYDINRQLCKGTWSITRGGIQLVDGSCNGTVLPPDKQKLITNNTLFLGVSYMSSLVEFLGSFATTRNESKWIGPYMATGMAAMLWSRITALDSAANLDATPALQRIFSNLTYEDAGLVYPVSDTVMYIRPTLRKSSLLYAIFAIQPLLIFVVLVLTPLFRSTPVDEGFGLISILSGVDRGSLDVLAGAALSGKLARSVKLVVQPREDSKGNGAVEYRCQSESSTGRHLRSGRLNPRTIYH